MTPLAVIATVLGYIAVLFVVAWLSGRRADNAGFFTGNRSTPWYMAAFAMIGAAISGVTFISVPGSVAVDSFSYMQMVAGFTVGQLVVAFLLIPTFYRLRVVSLYEYLDGRFGILSHHTGAWFFFVSKMLGAALRVYVVCAVMQLLVFSHYGLPFWLNALVTMLFVWLYTQQGGVKSLIWTDTLKTFCLVGSLVLSIVFIMQALGMSFGEMTREVAASPYSRVFFFDDPSSDRYFWKMFLAGVVLLISMTGLDQDMMQRNLSCATPGDSQKTIVLTAVSQIFVIFLFLVLGVLLYIYIGRTGLAMPVKGDQVFSLVAVEGGLPVFVGILFVIGLISSTYSAAGSALTALTTSFTVDILQGTRRYGDERLTRIRKGVHVGMAVGMALAPQRAPAHGAGHGGCDPRLRLPGRRQRHQPGLQGCQLYLRADPGYVRLRDVHAPEDPRRLDARGRRRRPRAERPRAILGARGVGLPDRVRTFDLQCRLYHGRHVVACQEE